MKEKCKWIGSICLFIIVLPIIGTLFISGRKSCQIIKNVEVEDYLPVVVAMEIPWNYEREAIAAQTILTRTMLYREIKEGKMTNEVGEAIDELKKREKTGKNLECYQVFQEVAKETKGKVLCSQQELKEVPFHRMSAGKTRDGEEILGEEYAYITGVEASEDLSSEEYLKGYYFTAKELEKKIKPAYVAFAWEEGEKELVKIIKSDSAGYVLEVQVGNQLFQGEELRELLQMQSSCFMVEIVGEKIRFLCKGMGHGLGMSQFAASKMAEQGESYGKILKYFYPNLEISLIMEDNS